MLKPINPQSCYSNDLNHTQFLFSGTIVSITAQPLRRHHAIPRGVKFVMSAEKYLHGETEGSQLDCNPHDIVPGVTTLHGSQWAKPTLKERAKAKFTW
jgi:hypothetical protein